MIQLNELVIDGVRTSSFSCEILVETRPKLVVSGSKTELFQHNGLSGAVLKSNKHRSLIEKKYRISMINASDRELYEFSSLLARENFWFESEQEPSIKYWCYKVDAFEIEKDEFGAFIIEVTFICHPTKFFKDSDKQVVSAYGEDIVDKHTIWFYTGQLEANQKGYQLTPFVRYSRFSDGRQFSDVIQSYVGVAKDFSDVAPTDADAYSWTKLKSRSVRLVYANSIHDQVDYTEVGTNPNAKLVAKGHPQFNCVDDTWESIRFVWQARQLVTLKANTTYTLTVRGRSKHYREGTQDYLAYLFVDFGLDSPIRASIDFKNNNYETKSVTFTTPRDLDTSKKYQIRPMAFPEDGDWTGLSLDWFTLYEGNKVYSSYPVDEPARFARYNFLGVQTTVRRPSGGGGVIHTQGSALAYPQIVIEGNSSGETSFTIGKQRIKLASLQGRYVMTNDPRAPSFLDEQGRPVKWSGDFITIDPMTNKTLGVVLGEGIQSLTFDIVWGWA